MRKTIYLSERLDKDIISFIEKGSFIKDFSREMRELLRDGIRFREGMFTKKDKHIDDQRTKLEDKVVTNKQKKTLDLDARLKML